MANDIDLDAANRVATGVFGEYQSIRSLPSIAWGLIEDGRVLCGHDTASVYRIASMTKSFTCAALVALRDDGTIRLDDPLSKYAPEFAHLHGPTDDSPPITIRHLMTMGSGLATDDAWADRHLDVDANDLDSWLVPGATFAVAPDTEFEYSNLGFGLLGRVVERAAGERLQDLVTRRLLEPLGMKHTTWVEPPGARQGLRSDGGVEPALGDGAIAPMGGLFTTVEDVARWVGFMTDAWPARDGHDSSPICRSSRREMQRIHRGFAPQTVHARDGRVRTIVGGYGFGLNVMWHDPLGWVVSHSGGLPGFGSNMRWVPSLGFGLVAFANLTYAEMAEATAATLDALVANDVVRARRPPVSDAIADAGAALIGLVNEWSDEAAGDLFADNVALDESLSDRRRAFEAYAVRGPFVVARTEADHGASATVIAHGRGVELRIEFQLHPLSPPRVQWYEATVVD